MDVVVERCAALDVHRGERRTVGEVYSFIAAEQNQFPIAVLCRVLKVNRTPFHNWERRRRQTGRSPTRG
jgi:hypothetical protein